MLPLATIGIDIGVNCGFGSIDSDGKRRDSGTWRLPPDRERWAEARRSFDGILVGEIFEAGDPSRVVVCYEAVMAHYAPKKPGDKPGEPKTMIYAAHIYGGLQALLELATLDQGVKCYCLNVGTWKKTATGKGNATKPQYIDAANQRWSLDLAMRNEDEAAALNIAYACLHQLGGPDLPVSGQQGRLL